LIFKKDIKFRNKFLIIIIIINTLKKLNPPLADDVDDCSVGGLFGVVSFSDVCFFKVEIGDFCSSGGGT